MKKKKKTFFHYGNSNTDDGWRQRDDGKKDWKRKSIAMRIEYYFQVAPRPLPPTLNVFLSVHKINIT